jgi:hypothetical protein
MSSPRDEYRRRLDARDGEASTLAARERRLSNGRLIAFASFVVLAWFAWVRGAIPSYWTGLPVVGFVALAVMHERTIRARKHAGRAAAFYRRALDRIDDRWHSAGSNGERFSDPHHPYAADLDLFGNGSLFQRISSARTRHGEETLAAWLLSPSSREEAISRQEAIAELRDRIDFREALAVIGDDVESGIHPADLIAWAEAPREGFRNWERIVAPLLGIASLVSAIAFFPPLSAGPIPVTVAVVVEFLFYRHLRGRIASTLSGVEKAGDDLALLGMLLHRIEEESFASVKLAALKRNIESAGARASDRIARLQRLIALLDSARNQFFAPFAGLLLWVPQVAFAVDRWRAGSGSAVRRWIDAVAELETLASLAAFAYEHPEYPFPSLLTGGRIYRAQSLGHPLIPGSRRVSIVSGSNMSGKSTMLRTVGINAVLAFAGAPVCASSLELSPLQVGASIRINDSLQEGSSRFYSELTRLRQLVDLTGGPRPLLFLLDEIFHGTNSHDRRIGAEAVIASLVRRGAAGLVTTHDLALAAIAQKPELRAKNVHFEDHMENGQMVFDYRMREGTVEKSNAIELMRAVGLEV